MRAKLAILLLAVTVTVPTLVDATWGAKGMKEPDTLHDQQDGWMFQNAPQLPLGTLVNGTPLKDRVYFNGFTSQSIGLHAEVGTSINPNFATLGSERQSWNGRVMAMLGTWLDCNGDGFIGWGDNALLEYRSALLVGPYNTGICPVNSAFPAPGVSGRSGFVASHNDGQWVREFIPIGPELNDITQPPGDANPYDYRDDGARVWADWGAPGDIPPTTRCYAFAPDGAYHSTGGFLQYVDCFDGFAVTDIFDAGVGLAGNPGGVSFADHPRDQQNSASSLNKRNPWGDRADSSDVYVFDCSQPQIYHSPSSVTVGTTTVSIPAVVSFGVSQPRTSPSVVTTGTAAGTMNETSTALDDCNRANNRGTNQDALANLPYSQEKPGIAITNGGGKQQTDFVLGYSEGFRDPPLSSIVPNPLGHATKKDAGLGTAETEGFYIGTTIIGEDRNPYTNREVLKSGSVFAPVQYVTTYASLTTSIGNYGLVLPAGAATGVYGAENCGTATSGVVKGWRCSPTGWWPGACPLGYNCCNTDPNGGYACTITVEGDNHVDGSVSVGHAYNLRDVDCYDSSISQARDAGVSYGVLTTTVCQ